MDFVAKAFHLQRHFEFCVIPFRHLFRRSPFDNLEEIGSTSLINKSGKRSSSLYVDVPFVLFFQHLHRVSLNIYFFHFLVHLISFCVFAKHASNDIHVFTVLTTQQHEN
jgi:hypothetical protein